MQYCRNKEGELLDEVNKKMEVRSSVFRTGELKDKERSRESILWKGVDNQTDKSNKQKKKKK